jgi:hypothetical protein
MNYDKDNKFFQMGMSNGQILMWYKEQHDKMLSIKPHDGHNGGIRATALHTNN